jgi:hypothetical protein
METNSELSVCENVERVGAVGLLGLIHAEADLDIRADLMEHVLFCPQCSEVHRRSLAQNTAEVQQPISLWRSVLKPLVEWFEKPQAELVEVYGLGAMKREGAREWKLNVGEEDGVSPASFRLVLVECEDGSQKVFIKSDHPTAAYVVRGFSGARTVFEIKLKDGKGQVAKVDGEFDPEGDIEVFQVN